jgi:hypothetical protein
MFNAIFSVYQLFLLALSAFFALFIFRHLLIKKKLLVILYHIILGCILFIGAIVGGGVGNDAYERLEQFIELEKNYKLKDAKQNLQKYDPMLAIDIQQFRNSDEFRIYLKKHNHIVDIAEAIFIGWIFLILSDTAMLCVHFIRYIAIIIKLRFF